MMDLTLLSMLESNAVDYYLHFALEKNLDRRIRHNKSKKNKTEGIKL